MFVVATIMTDMDAYTADSASSTGVKRKRELPKPADLTCQSCIELFNNSTRKAVDCVGCDFRACRSCHERYLTTTVSDSHCMNCKRPWQESFLAKWFSKKWIHEWWLHRTKTIVQFQKSFLPQAAAFVPIQTDVNEKSEAYREAMSAYKRFQRGVDEGSEPNPMFKVKDFNKKAEVLLAAIRDTDKALVDSRRLHLPLMISYRHQVARIRHNAFTEHLDPNHLETGQMNPPLLLTESPPKDGTGSPFWRQDDAMDDGDEGPGHASASVAAAPAPKQSLWPCPTDGCRGFLNSDFECLVCKARVCSKCHANLSVKTDEAIPEEKHQCKPADVASVKLILKSSQECPNCHVRVFKIDGCDQMWCTHCKTAFSYETGERIQGHVHNPHYFQDLAQGLVGGAHGHGQPAHHLRHEAFGVFCGAPVLGDLGISRLSQHSGFLFTIMLAHQRHLSAVDVPAFRTKQTFLNGAHNAPVPLAFRYLLKEIGDTEWAAAIKAETLTEKFAAEVLAVYQTWLEAMEFQWAQLATLVQQRRVLRDLVTLEEYIVMDFNMARDDPDSMTQLALRHAEMVNLARVANTALHDLAKLYRRKPKYIYFLPYSMEKEYGRHPMFREKLQSLKRAVDPVRHVDRPDDVHPVIRRMTKKKMKQPVQAKRQRIDIHD